jgi:hypothetical protein
MAMRAKALVLTCAFVARARGATLPNDHDPELCPQTCAEPGLCRGAGCWVTRLAEKSARLRATMGAPGRRSLDPVGVYLDRVAKRRGA